MHASHFEMFLRIASLDHYQLMFAECTPLLHCWILGSKFFEEKDAAHQHLRQGWHNKWKLREAFAVAKQNRATECDADQRPRLTSFLADEFRGIFASSVDDSCNHAGELDTYFALPVADMHTVVIVLRRRHCQLFFTLNKMAR